MRQPPQVVEITKNCRKKSRRTPPTPRGSVPCQEGGLPARPHASQPPSPLARVPARSLPCHVATTDRRQADDQGATLHDLDDLGAWAEVRRQPARPGRGADIEQGPGRELLRSTSRPRTPTVEEPHKVTRLVIYRPVAFRLSPRKRDLHSFSTFPQPSRTRYAAPGWPTREARYKHRGRCAPA